MAFTKAPTQDTHGERRVLVSGDPFIVSNSVGVGTGQPTCKYVDCFPIKEQMYNNDPKVRIHKRLGWGSVACTGTIDTGNSLLTSSSSVQAYNPALPYMFFAKNAKIYSLNYNSKVVSAALGTRNGYHLGTGTNATDSSNVQKIAWLASIASSYLYTSLEDGTTVVETDLSAKNLDGARGLVFINGYLFAVDSNGHKIYNSSVGGNLTTWNSTDFLDAEQYADKVLWIDKHKNYLVAFGQASIEFFYDNSTEVGSPLARQESYSTRIGLYQSAALPGGSWTVHFEDDIYFLGITESNTVSLYRIHNFQVEEIDSQFIQELLNMSGGDCYGISAALFNNNPHVLLNFNGLTGRWAYFIKENTWWNLAATDYPIRSDQIGQLFIPFGSNPVNSAQPIAFLIKNTASTGDVALAYETGASVASTIYSDVIDFDNNRYKHLARIDSIGDYGSNSITLSVCPSNNYSQTFNSCGSAQVASTIGYGQNMSWYNCGAPRRFILATSMTGTGIGMHEGWEIEYNMGVS